MNVVLVLAIAGAGGVGACLRYLVDHSLPSRLRRAFPWATAIVNLTGSFAIGALTGMILSFMINEWILTATAGLLGGYTTFSTASVETARLLRERRNLTAAVYGIGVLIGCVALAALGLTLTLGLRLAQA